VRISTESKERWNDKFLSQNIENIQNLTKVYLVGPIGFMLDIKKCLLNSGKVNEDQLLLV